jgi:hypothetical protein
MALTQLARNLTEPSLAPQIITAGDIGRRVIVQFRSYPRLNGVGGVVGKLFDGLLHLELNCLAPRVCGRFLQRIHNPVPRLVP